MDRQRYRNPRKGQECQQGALYCLICLPHYTSLRVAVPPLPSFTEPSGKVCQMPPPGASKGSRSPVQYCTWYLVACGAAQAMRTALISILLPRSTVTHCGWSASPVKGFVRYGLLFQNVFGSPSVRREYPSPSPRV